jgi:hypothetical protein
VPWPIQQHATQNEATVAARVFIGEYGFPQRSQFERFWAAK